MLNEFDQYLNKRYLSGKARKERWYRNHSIQRGRSTAVKENWQWKPAVAYCRHVDDFVLIVKGTKAQAKAIREERWGARRQPEAQAEHRQDQNHPCKRRLCYQVITVKAKSIWLIYSTRN